MLSRIFIQNFALIDHLEIDLGEGLLAITGETGAGKSIILGALRLIMGERADAKSFAKADSKSIVETEFLINENLKPFFEQHDLDFEKYPDQHCKKAPELLKEIDADDAFIHAVVCHGYGICVDVAPEHLMEKVLFAADELTGLIWAAAKMRPSKSTKDMEVKSLKKKFKDKRFAAGCSRDVIKQGAETLGWDLNDLFEKTILAMRSCEDGVRKECLELTGVEE